MNTFKDRPFAIVGINSERDREEFKKVVEKEQIPWRSWWDGGMGNGGPIAAQWNVHTWPRLYLIDHKGMIAENSVWLQEMDQRIEQLVLAAEGKPVALKEEKAAAEITNIPPKDLVTNVPNFFSFPAPGQPQPGKRYWLRIDHRHWVERYPDGLESTFQVLGRAQVQGNHGTVVVKISGDQQKTLTANDGSFQLFIPDKGSNTMAILLRRAGAPDSTWVKLADMEHVD